MRQPRADQPGNRPPPTNGMMSDVFIKGLHMFYPLTPALNQIHYNYSFTHSPIHSFTHSPILTLSLT